ncbi:MAG: integrase core domain-containing protein [Candidatus Eisenbacteria bacterium]
MDEWTRESLAIEVDAKLNAARSDCGAREVVRSVRHAAGAEKDNGPEFIAHALSLWAKFKHSEIATIQPGKPWQNGSIESFNGTFRAECLTAVVREPARGSDRD